MKNLCLSCINKITAVFIVKGHKIPIDKCTKINEKININNYAVECNKYQKNDTENSHS